MTAVINIFAQKFGSSKNLPIFVVRNRVNYRNSHNTYFITADKAVLLRQFYFGSLARFRKNIKGGLPLLYLYIAKLSISQMRNRDENLQADARGASASTPNTRKRVTSTCAKSAQTQPSNICKNFLQSQKLYLHLQCSDQEPNSANIVEVFLRPNLNGLFKSFVSVKSASAICTCSWSNKRGLAAFLVSFRIVNFI